MMRAPSSSPLCALLLALALTSARANAQDAAPAASGPQAAEYQRTIDAALEEYGAGHYEEARGLFEHAHQLEPSARTLRGLGMAEFELRHYVRSAELLSEALQSAQKPLTAEQRKSVQELLARTERFVARYQLSVEPAEAQPRVQVDGRPVELPADRRIALSAGEHHLSVAATGYATSELAVDAVGGEEHPLAIELRALSTSGPAVKDVSQAPVAPPPLVRPYRRLGIGLFASGLTVVAAGVTLGGIGLHDAKQAAARNDADAHHAQHLALAGDVAIGVGAASALSGLVLWLWRRPEQAPAARGLRVEAGLPNLQVKF